MDCQPCRIMRVASGMFRKTCASTTPPRPKIETSGRLSPRSPAFSRPERPKTAKRPRTAAMTGSRKGAPRAVIKTVRPGKRRLASARAKGTAQTTEASAESVACSRVKRSAAQSGAVSPRPPACAITTATGASVASATPAAISAPARRAIRPAPGRAGFRPPPPTTAAISTAGRGSQTLSAARRRG